MVHFNDSVFTKQANILNLNYHIKTKISLRSVLKAGAYSNVVPETFHRQMYYIPSKHKNKQQTSPLSREKNAPR